jgi:LPS-assembly protein
MIVRKLPGFLTVASLLMLATSAPALAQANVQNAADTPAPIAAPAPTPDAPEDIDVDFKADNLDYDNETEIVQARGRVEMIHAGNKLEADEVDWDRKTGKVMARGNVRITNPSGDTAYGDTIELTDSLKDGMVDNLLIVLANGGRLAAVKGQRIDGGSQLERAVYSPCRVVDEAGCAKNPVWRITAVNVKHDPVKNRVYYKKARLEMFGVPFLALPGFSHIAKRESATGFLIPDIQYSRTNGFELAMPYHIAIAPNRDLTLTPHVFTNSLPALEGRYRALTGNGAYQIGAYATSSSRTDRTFLRRYDISSDDRLRSTIAVSRVSRSSYLSISGWGFQTLRPLERQGLVPIALPIVDYRKRFNEVLGGRAEVQLNSLMIGRTDGQETQRAFAGARWDMRRLTGLGQEVIFTGYVRGDVYHTDNILSTPTALYRGQAGWNGRVVSAFAAEMRWPFVGQFAGGTQRLTPRLQVVASPNTANLKVPNEDARAVDLEDSNLFSLNRFPGYDRWEDGTRITYGLDWNLDLPGLAFQTTIGQSYRLTSKPSLFAIGTGLSSRTSDIVGRTTVKYKRLVNLTYRYRLDKNSLAFRRSEIDATIGTDKTYVTASYLRLNRNIGPQLEDLRDREEIRLGGRVQVSKFWSFFGSTIVDLTGPKEDALALTDGYEPIRHRLGIAYEDDCLKLSLAWKRNYVDSGDARKGNSYVIRLGFKNLGF